MVERKDGKSSLSRKEDPDEPSTSTGVKRRMMDLITIDSDSENEEDGSPSLGQTVPIRDSSIPPNQVPLFIHWNVNTIFILETD